MVMDAVDINEALLTQLQTRAKREGCSVNALLERWLDLPPSADTPTHDTVELLRESETRYRLLAENSRDAISLHTPDGRSLYFNPTSTLLTGYSIEELETMTLEDLAMLVHPEDTSQAKHDEYQQTLRGDQITTNEYRFRRKDGSYIWLETNSTPIFDAAGEVAQILVTSREITARKQAEETLRQSEGRYKLLTEVMSDYAASLRVEPDGDYVPEWVVGAFEQITGYQPGQEIETHPDDKERRENDLKRTLQGERVVSEFRIRHKNGHYVWLRVSRQPEWDQTEGRVVRFYSVVKDVTAQKQAEQMRLEQERLKASLTIEQQYNVLMQQAVTALSHDLRTPLTVILSSKNILSRYFDQLSEEKRQEKLTTIERQLQLALEMLDDMVLRVRGDLNGRVFRPKSINLAALCQLVIEETNAVYQTNHMVQFVDGLQPMQTVPLDEILVSRILLNLLSNAVKYSPEGDNIRLEIDQHDNWVRLRVVDHGMGIASDDLPHIFTPFYRAGNAQALMGTGLGLSIVQDCVERHHGRISVESKPGSGTTFTVELPLLVS